MRRGRLVLLPLALLLLGLESVKLPPVPLVPSIDLPRYMGRWYVIANIPTSFERGAHNSVESYTLNPDGTIDTLFTCRADGFDGGIKKMKPRAWVKDASTNSAWWIQFIWPLKAEHLIAYVSPDYTQTIIARTKRDYVWIMARTPEIPESDFQALAAKVGELGYDRSKLERVPQRW